MREGFGVVVSVVVVGVVVVLVGGTIVLRYNCIKGCVLVDLSRIQIQIRGCISTPYSLLTYNKAYSH